MRKAVIGAHSGVMLASAVRAAESCSVKEIKKMLKYKPHYRDLEYKHKKKRF